MLTDIKPGVVIDDKFRIERVLGKGGMGFVVEATHLQLDQRVALKFLLPQVLMQPESLARFAREARAAAKIKSEHVARVLDVGTLDTGAPYMVMEYLDGVDLARRVAEQGRLPTSEAVDFILQACEALAEAHAVGIVHRDLKPANLFVASYPDGTPCVKILDFGISKLADAGSGPALDMTTTATIMGSPHYMSPEQMRSTRTVDARTDIWALGVILYQLVSGHVPFEAETMPQLCGMVLQEPPPPLSKFNADVPGGFEALILRCLEKDAAQRYQSVAELVLALAPFGSGDAHRSVDRVQRVSGAVPRDAGVVSAPMSSTARSPLDAGAGASAGSGHRSRLRWALMVGLALVGLAGAWIGLQAKGLSFEPRPSAAAFDTDVEQITPQRAAPEARSSTTAAVRAVPGAPGSAEPRAASPTLTGTGISTPQAKPKPKPVKKRAATVNTAAPPGAETEQPLPPPNPLNGRF